MVEVSFRSKNRKKCTRSFGTMKPRVQKRFFCFRRSYKNWKTSAKNRECFEFSCACLREKNFLSLSFKQWERWDGSTLTGKRFNELNGKSCLSEGGKYWRFPGEKKQKTNDLRQSGSARWFFFVSTCLRPRAALSEKTSYPWVCCLKRK